MSHQLANLILTSTKYSYKLKETHTYYPDYFVEMVDGTKIVVEIKPYNQTQKPVNENCCVGYQFLRC